MLVFNGGGFQAGMPLSGALANAWLISSGSAAYFFGTNAIQLSGSSTITGSESIHIPNPALTVTLSGLLNGGGTLIRATDTATSGNGALVINNPNSTFTGGFTLQSNGGNVDVQGASTTGPAGAVTSGPLGTGPVTLNSANTTFSNLWNSSATPVTLGNNLNIYDAAGFTSTAGLNFTGTTTLTGPDNAGITQLFVGASSNVTFAGVISGGTNGINLRAPGGFLTLSGLNTYAGGTGISAGTLYVAGNALSGSPGPVGQRHPWGEHWRRQLCRLSCRAADHRQLHDRASNHGECHGRRHDFGNGYRQRRDHVFRFAYSERQQHRHPQQPGRRRNHDWLRWEWRHCGNRNRRVDHPGGQQRRLQQGR